MPKCGQEIFDILCQDKDFVEALKKNPDADYYVLFGELHGMTRDEVKRFVFAQLDFSLINITAV